MENEKKDSAPIGQTREKEETERLEFFVNLICETFNLKYRNDTLTVISAAKLMADRSRPNTKQKDRESLNYKIDTMLKALWAIRDKDEFYFKTYGKQWLEDWDSQKPINTPEINIQDSSAKMGHVLSGEEKNNEVAIGRVQDAAHKCCQWEDGEVVGFDLGRFYDKVRGILMKPEPVLNQSAESLTYEKLMNEWGDDTDDTDPFEWLLKNFKIVRR